jgi:hypothetical protein
MMTYAKMWVSYDSLVSWNFQGLLREEADIVYYRPPNSSEGVLYDFTLEIGDSALVRNIFCGVEEIPIHIVNIDTVEYFGKSLRRWHLGADGNVEELWIEGIGSLNGPLYTKYWYCIVCPIWELLCFHNNDTLEFIAEGETGCYHSSVGINDRYGKGDDLIILPNPVMKGSEISVETATKPVSIALFNSAGLLIRTINPVNDKKTFIETSSFESGLYFITVMTNDNKKVTKKILIQ